MTPAKEIRGGYNTVGLIFEKWQNNVGERCCHAVFPSVFWEGIENIVRSGAEWRPTGGLSLQIIFYPNPHCLWT
jgi:hypothetical protein